MSVPDWRPDCLTVAVHAEIFWVPGAHNLTMNQRLLTILFAAFALAAAAAYGVYRFAGNAMTSQVPVTSRVLVATRTIEIGNLIRDEDVKSIEWLGSPPTTAIVKKESAVGRGVVSALYEGEPVMENRLAAPGSGGGLAATIPNGMRACAVRVNEVVGVSGFALPGMRVDVLIAGTSPSSPNEGPRVKTLLQNIQVLSAGANYQQTNDGKPVSTQVVNLLVTPEQAEVLSLASNETRIQLVLRNPLDTQTSAASGAGMRNLFNDVPAPVAPRPAAPRPVPVAVVKQLPPPPPPPPQFLVVEVLNGSKRTSEKFDEKSSETKEQK